MDTSFKFIAIVFIAMILQLVIVYFIIKSATKSAKLYEQNQQVISLLKVIALNVGGTPSELIASEPGMFVSPVLPSKYEDVEIEVRVKGLEGYAYRFEPEIKERIIRATANKEETIMILKSQLYRAL